MQIRGHDIGVCSWSLQPRDMHDLVAKLKQLELQHVQLSLNDLLMADAQSRGEQLRVLRDAGIVITAGMIGFAGEDYSTIAAVRKVGGFAPDTTWPQRRDLTIAAAHLASEIGVQMVSTHIGFIPASNDPHYATIAERVAEVADALSAVGVSLLMETSKETASEVLQFINDLRSRGVGVNFDPANMILYGAGDPIDAIRVLGRHIRHVHVKDAKLSDQPRVKWGSEVAFGSGQVHPRRLFDGLDAVEYTGPLVIEREAGTDRMRDIAATIQLLEKVAAD